MQSSIPITSVETVLIPLELLRPHEEIEWKAALELSQRIGLIGEWTAPLAVAQGSFCVMDGHHRLAAARILRLKRVPCVLYHYDQIPVYTRRPEIAVDSGSILERSRSGVLLPPKSTRHVLPQSVVCAVSLERLREDILAVKPA